MSENVIDIIKLGIEYILLAIFLLFVVQVIQIRNSYASNLNNKNAQTRTAQESLEFSSYRTGDMDPADNTKKKYLSECITGDDVLACIRNYSDGSVKIYVDGMQGTDDRIDDGLTIFDTDAANTPKWQYIYSEEWLSDHLYVDGAYHPYLIYDNYAEPMEGYDDNQVISKKPEWYTNNRYAHKGEAVTGIVFIRYKG